MVYLRETFFTGFFFAEFFKVTGFKMEINKFFGINYQKG